MKRLSDLLHHTPWWLLLVCGLATAIALVVFATPFQTIRLERSASSPEQKRAIKREIDLAFSEGLVDVAGTVLREMRDRSKDPARREELDAALEDIETARESLREAGAEAQRAKREASQDVANAIRDAHDALAQAHRQAADAVKDAGPEGARVEKSLADSLQAAEEAANEAKKVDAPPMPAPPAPPRIVIKKGGGSKPLVELQVDSPSVPVPPLPPDMKRDIRQKLTTDLWRIGVGTGLLLILLPLFILAVVSKFFIDRSRASLKVAEAKKREAEYHRMSRQVTEAKLAALQAQVEPHFLYNTLASVQALTEVDPRKANEMTGHLIQYLRNALPKMRESVSTVGQEVELVRAYLNILQMRMGKRLGFDIEVAPGLEEASFPPLMLPSLVENAIKHGLEPLREGGHVSIALAQVDGKVRATVADTGRGFAETLGAGVGLANIRERLAALYGEAGKLTLEAYSPHGVIATIEIPREAPSPQAAQASLAASRAQASTPAAPPPSSVPDTDGPAEATSIGPASAGTPASPATRTQRFLSGMGSAERAWRKALTYAFVVLVGVAGVIALLAAIGLLTGSFHIRAGERMMGNAAGAFLGTAGIAIAFVVAVIALAIVLAVIYGLGFVLIAVLVVVIAAVLVALFPVLAPFVLLGLLVAWLARRASRRGATLESPDAHRHPG